VLAWWPRVPERPGRSAVTSLTHEEVEDEQATEEPVG